MAIITNLLLSAELTNWVGKLLELLYQWIGNFGWTVVVFSILLKLILSPLDIWQKSSSRKQQKKMALLKPKLEKLEKQYGKNPDLLKQKQYELQRSEKINVFSSCIPLIITMVVFFVVFSGFRALVTYENEKIVEELDEVYVSYILDYNYNNLNETQKTEIENSKTDWNAIKTYCDQNAASGFIDYDELKEIDSIAFSELTTALADKYTQALDSTSWLWVKNVFKSDTGTNVIPDSKSYTSSGIGGIGASLEDTVTHTSYSNLVQPAIDKYNRSGTWDIKNWNGYFVLPILSLLTCFLSTFLMQKSTPQTSVGTKEQLEQQQKTMKMMNYMMPVMLAVFAILYSAAFAIYYLISNIMSTLTTLLFNLYASIKDKKEATIINNDNNIVINSKEVK